MEPVHEIIETLAQSLGRSIAVDDAELRLIASSTHFADADAARLQSLVGRRVEGLVRTRVLGAGVRSWRTPQRLAADPAIGADMARMCFPLTSHYELLGFMWVMEATPLSDDEMEACAAAAEAVQELLARKTQYETDAAKEIDALVLNLLSPSSKERTLAAGDLFDLELFRGAAMYTAFALVAGAGPLSIDADGTSLIRRALATAQRGRFARLAASAVSDQASFLVIGHRAPLETSELKAIAERILGELRRQSPALADAAVIGVGEARDRLDDVFISFEQAVEAARDATRTDHHISFWGDDPLAALLNAAFRPDIDEQMLPAPLRSIEQQHQDALPLLAAYLDNAANAAQTADDLHLHRTTVYYRIKRFQVMTGLDLDDGETRLLVHLWIKLRPRLGGADDRP